MATLNDTTSDPLGGTMPSPQYAMLDMLIPGFSLFSSTIYAYLGIDLNLYIPLVLVASGLVFSGSYVYQNMYDLINKHLMSSVRIRTDDEIFNMVMGWAAHQSFSKRSRRFIVNTNLNSRNWLLWRLFDDEEDDDDEDRWYGPGFHKKKNKKMLRYTPSYGTHLFWYRGWPLFFERCENREQFGSLMASEKEEIHISCIGRSPEILKELLLEARENHMKKDEDKTLIYRGASGANFDDPTWKRCMARSTRPFSTVILNEGTKKRLVDDVTDYLNPATRRWYANRGIPYRRGYLLYGPPGTGKSSLSLALAGFFNMRIYILSLSSPMATEENVSSLFSSLPRRCVVLLEDIDSAGLTHTRDDGTPSPPADTSGSSSTPAKGSNNNSSSSSAPAIPPARLSLSGLLNILDGVASQEGRVLIMTTNHLEKLDKALIRPGRVDMTVEFGRADAGMTASIFRAIYAPCEGEESPLSPKKDASEEDVPDDESTPKEEEDPEKAKEKKKEVALKVQERISELAETFASKIPEHEFSPAEIQGLLLRHKRDPLAVIDAAEEWVVQTRKDKEEKELREAEEKRVEEEKKKKEEEKKKKEEEKEKRKAEKRKAKKKAKKAKKGEDKASSGEDSSDSESESENESEVKEKTESKDGGEGKDKQEKKLPSDSGYGTP